MVAAFLQQLQNNQQTVSESDNENNSEQINNKKEFSTSSTKQVSSFSLGFDQSWMIIKVSSDAFPLHVYELFNLLDFASL